MRSVLLLPLALIAACSGSGNQAATVDVDNAARSAENNIDSYAADTGAGAAPRPAASAPAAAPSSPAPHEVVSEAPFTPDSAQGAADVVQTYYALIEGGKYRAAWALWDDAGKASGMTAAAFAASFDRYADYHAEVGAPGRIDSGAGQRYVTVPVKVRGTLKAGGKPFAAAGDVVLHRAGDIDGATDAQKRWHISTADIKPVPADAATADATPATATARYACDGGFAFTVRFDNRADTATLRRNGAALVTLDGQRPASGIWYKGGGWELRGKGRDADLTRLGAPPVTCRAA